MITEKVKNLAIVVLVSISFSAQSQSYDYYRIYAGVSYLPSCGHKSEVYLKKGKSITHIFKDRSYKNCKMLKTSKLPLSRNAELSITYLDSLMHLNSFAVSLPNGFLNELKSDTFYKKYYKISDTDIDNYFKINSSFILSLNDIQTDPTDEDVVVDCNHFAISWEVKAGDKDTLKYTYSGNLCDGVKSRDINRWLPLYLLHKKYALFSSLKPVAEFVDERHFRSVVFRFMAWKKNA